MGRLGDERGEGDWEEFRPYQLPITNYQLPITNYQLPITHYPLPITKISYRRRTIPHQIF